MEQTQEPEFRIGDYVKILKRRYLFLVIPFVILFSASVGVATLLPPIYVSQGTILIESPQISQEIVAGSIDSAARERIEVIKQRVMTRANLLRIANEFRVFEGETKRPTSTEIVSKMRSTTRVSFISGGGRSRGAATIAFTVSFEHRRADIAARVANEIVTLFMDENVRTRTQIATETTDFLNQEARKLEQHLAEIETKIAEYKQENSSSLPENLEIRIGMRERTESGIRETDRDIKSIEEEMRFLDIQLAAFRSGFGQSRIIDGIVIDDTIDEEIGGETKMPPMSEFADAELEELRDELDEALLKYSEAHPDIKALRRKISLREESLAEDDTLEALAFQVEAKEREISDAKDQGDTAKVAELTESVELLKSQILEQISEPDEDLRAVRAEQRQNKINQARAKQEQQRLEFEQERADAERTLQIESIEAKIGIASERIGSLKNQKLQLQSRLEEIEQTILQTPLVDRALKSLNRDYENAQQKYNEVRSKAMQAQIAENVEEASKAERFVLLEPPTVPDTPIKPNRKKLLVMGLALSFGAGAVGIVGIEFIDGSIRGAGQLETALSIVPLATIPYIVTAKEQRGKVRRRYAVVIAGVLLMVGAVGGLHYFYKPIDEIFYKVIDRFA